VSRLLRRRTRRAQARRRPAARTPPAARWSPAFPSLVLTRSGSRSWWSWYHLSATRSPSGTAIRMSA